MAAVNVSKGASGRIIVAFPYDPSRVAKVKTIEGHQWHPEKRHWCPTNSPARPRRWIRASPGALCPGAKIPERGGTVALAVCVSAGASVGECANG